MMALTWLSAILVGAGCLALGYYFGARHPARLLISSATSKAHASSSNNGSKKKNSQAALEIEKLADILEDFKMVHGFLLSLVVEHSCNIGCLSLWFMSSHFSNELIFLKVLVVRNDLKMGKGKIAAQCRYWPKHFLCDHLLFEEFLRIFFGQLFFSFLEL